MANIEPRGDSERLTISFIYVHILNRPTDKWILNKDQHIIRQNFICQLIRQKTSDTERSLSRRLRSQVRFNTEEWKNMVRLSCFQNSNCVQQW